MATLSVVIVAFNSREALAATLPTLAEQLREADELIVVDNGSDDGTRETVASLVPKATVIEAGVNLGFSAGSNRGAAAATSEVLCLLNPDAVPSPGWRDAIELPYDDGRGWAAWQALITAEGGRVLNTRGGVVHFTGIAWAGDAGRRIDKLPPTESLAIDEPGFVPAPAWRSRVRPSSTPADSPNGSSSITRTSTCRCAYGSPAARSGLSPPPASTTTTSSTRASTSGATSSEIAGRR